MDQPYSPFADWLSKFHMSSEPIQALWIVTIVTLVLGLAYFAKEIVVAALRPSRHSEAAKRSPEPIADTASKRRATVPLRGMSAFMGPGLAPLARPGMTLRATPRHSGAAKRSPEPMNTTPQGHAAPSRCLSAVGGYGSRAPLRGPGMTARGSGGFSQQPRKGGEGLSRIRRSCTMLRRDVPVAPPARHGCDSGAPARA